MIKIGADVHAYLEKFNKETRQWENANLYKKNSDGTFTLVNFYNGRNYDLFGKLAGVRGSEDPMVYPRGLPDDLSPEVKEEFGDGLDWHSATWYDMRELELLVKAGEGKVPCWDEDDNMTTYDPVADFVEAARVALDMQWIWVYNMNEVRVVIWFDS